MKQILVVTAAVILLATACGGSSATSSASSPAGTPGASATLVAFSHCMRTHGVPSFPDPTRAGIPKISPQQAGVSSARFTAAQRACTPLLQPAQAQVSQVMTGMLDFARCMRAHGVPNWPDPSLDSNDQPDFYIPGINPDSAHVSNTADACSHLLVQSKTGPTTIQLCDGTGEDGGCHGYGSPPGS
jgi:hypothetical protein